MRKILALVLAAGSPAAFAQGLEPGQWEFTSSMTMQGMPKPQSHTLQRCVTREESSDPQKWMGKQQDQTECKVTMKERSASQVRWEISCPKRNMTGAGVARIGRGTMETEQTMRGEMQGRPFEMHMKMSGKRLGACK